MLQALVLALFLVFCQAGWASGQWNHSLVKVRSYIQKPDFAAPWKTISIRKDEHMGIVLDRQHILVSSFAVAYGKHFEFQEIGSSHFYPLRLAFVDYNANLALLTPLKPEPFDRLKPISIGSDVSIGSEVQILTARDRQRLIAYQSRIQEVVVQDAIFSNYALPHLVFETQQQAAGWSEPLMKEGKLVGLTVSKLNERVYAIPAGVIKRFYDEFRKEKYRGFVKLGLELSPLTSLDLRRFKKISHSGQGLWIRHVTIDSPFKDAVITGDVLLKVGSMPISDQGLYKHQLWGTLSFLGAMFQYYEGETLTLELMRDGKIVRVSRKLAPYDPLEELIPTDTPRKEPYLIFGGLIFQELSEPFLKSWGKDWQERAPIYFLNLFYHQNYRTKTQPQRVLILNRVLADEFNKGYDSLRHMHLIRVNGHEVQGMNDLKSVLIQGQQKTARGVFVVFEFEPFQHKIVLSYEGIVKAHERIAKNYGIEVDKGFYPTTDILVESK